MTDSDNFDNFDNLDTLDTQLMDIPMDSSDESSPNGSPVKPPGVGTLLKNRNFSAMFVGGLISDIGSFFTFIAMMFLALDITSGLPFAESAQAIALITLFFILPSLFIGPFTGAFVDRFDRKKIMYIADLFGAFASFGLVYVAMYTRQIEHIYIFAVISTMVRLFFYPARGASIPVVVERPEALVQANGIIQIFAQLSRIIGPALAGILIATYSLEMAFIIDGVSYFISALLILSIRTDLKPKSEGSMTVRKIFGDLKFGASMIVRDKVMAFIMVFFMAVIFAIGMIDPLFVIYVSENFGLNEAEFGYILAVGAVTGLVTALLLTAKGSISKKVTFTTASVFIASASLLILGNAASLPLPPKVSLYLGMAIIGAINVAFSIPLSALMQAIIPNEHLGKINGFLGTGIALSQVGGAALAAWMVTFTPISLIYSNIGLAL
ncbi:MAG: MFS transporter, partial [Candidatus Kariarchaeaceae archaeon]